MILTEIDHVAIAVHDLEEAVNYYQQAFGAEVHHREVVERDGVEEALIKVADSYIQLTTATRDDSPIAKFLQTRGEGLHHIGYRVQNCQAALQAMIAQTRIKRNNCCLYSPKGITWHTHRTCRRIDLLLQELG